MLVALWVSAWASPACEGSDLVAAADCEGPGCAARVVQSACVDAVRALQTCLAHHDGLGTRDGEGTCQPQCVAAVGPDGCRPSFAHGELVALDLGVCGRELLDDAGYAVGRAALEDRYGEACVTAATRLADTCRGTWTLTPAQEAFVAEFGHPPDDARLEVPAGCRAACVAVSGAAACEGDWRWVRERLDAWHGSMMPVTAGALSSDVGALGVLLGRQDAEGAVFGGPFDLGGGIGGLVSTDTRAAAPVGQVGLGQVRAPQGSARPRLVDGGGWTRLSGGGDAACAARGSEVLCRVVGQSVQFDVGGEVVALAVGGPFVVWATARGVEVRALTSGAATPDGAALAGVEALSASRLGWCAVAAGAVRCAGGNADGQLGDGTALARRGAVQVLGVSGAVRVISSDRWSCAHRWSGDLMCWGDGPDPGVRRGLATSQPGPIVREVTARGDALCAGGDVVRCGELAVSALAGASGLSGAATHVCGIAKGVVVCDALTPASRVAATAVAATTTGGCALTADGLVCWGM
jgi:hypothetical protein